MELGDLLDRRDVWRGRAGNAAGPRTIPTGFDNLDHYLPGSGWPVDALTEVLLDRYGIGELRLLMPALAGLSRRAAAKGQWIVWVGPPFVPYAPALSSYGIDLDCILLVHPSDRRRDVLWATEQIIRSASGMAVLAWIDDADVTALRRLQLGIERQHCWTVLFRPAAAAAQPSPARLRFRLSPEAEPSAAGFRARVDMLKCRARSPETLWVDTAEIRDRHVHAGDSGCR
jgi:hypothetical protein